MTVHHIELWSQDLAASARSWDWLFRMLAWQPDDGSWADGRIWTSPSGTYVVLEQSPALTRDGHDRMAPGMNHMALSVPGRSVLDELRADAAEHGWRELFAGAYPHAGGEQHVALFLENDQGFEVELVATEDTDTPREAPHSAAQLDVVEVIAEARRKRDEELMGRCFPRVLMSRPGPRPTTSTDGPHRRLDQRASPDLWGELVARVFALDDVVEGHSQVSPASSRAVFLTDCRPPGPPRCPWWPPGGGAPARRRRHQRAPVPPRRAGARAGRARAREHRLRPRRLTGARFSTLVHCARSAPVCRIVH